MQSFWEPWPHVTATGGKDPDTAFSSRHRSCHPAILQGRGWSTLRHTEFRTKTENCSKQRLLRQLLCVSRAASRCFCEVQQTREGLLTVSRFCCCGRRGLRCGATGTAGSVGFCLPSASAYKSFFPVTMWRDEKATSRGNPFGFKSNCELVKPTGACLWAKPRADVASDVRTGSEARRAGRGCCEAGTHIRQASHRLKTPKISLLILHDPPACLFACRLKYLWSILIQQAPETARLCWEQCSHWARYVFF